MKKGSQVRSLTLLQSDDAAAGIDDGSVIVQPGTVGTVLGRSEDFLEKGETLKGDGDCYVVDWGTVKYDTHVSEMEVCA